MFGMGPPVPEPAMPAAFSSAPRDVLYVPPPSPGDLELEAATLDAEAEWSEIQTALDAFEQSLGPDWQPLSHDAAAPIPTPFGTAIQYRTYHMSCIWSLFHAGRILAARMHPSMPPAAMMAAGIAAPQTAGWANTVGRIVFGLQPPSTFQPFNPSLGRALAECMFPMFVAGITYTDPHQRRCHVERLQLVAELTGVESAALIAAGCERCWARMHETGRGPPYVPTLQLTERQLENTTSSIRFPVEQQEPIWKDNGTTKMPISWAMGLMSLEEDYERMQLVRVEQAARRW
jgi:hypothetical protein